VIYQCYYAPEQASRLFRHEAYRGFGLEPVTNSNIVERCPELGCPTTRRALTEYAAFLHIWRHLPFDDDAWIGFTSYRQLDKTDFVFASAAEIERLLVGYDFLAWHWWQVDHVRHGTLTGAAAQGEHSHPLLHGFTLDVLRHFGIDLPEAYFREPEVPFANYWVMSKRHFAAYMDWSWPVMRYALDLEHPYKSYPHSWNPQDDKRKAVGYFMERLFVIWTLREGRRGRRLGAKRRA
jgi:hypothetical protein